MGNPKQGRRNRLISDGFRRLSDPTRRRLNDRSIEFADGGHRRPCDDVTQRHRSVFVAVANHEDGFTLVELLIVTTVLPLIIGALSVGLISVFSLQSGVSSRLANTSDAQVVAANYQSDIQGTSQITTASSSTPQCTSPTLVGTQLLGLWSNVNSADPDRRLLRQRARSSVARRRRTHSSVSTAAATSQLGQRPRRVSRRSRTTFPRVSPLRPSRAWRVSRRVCAATRSRVKAWVSSQNISEVSMTIAEPSTAADAERPVPIPTVSSRAPPRAARPATPVRR